MSPFASVIAQALGTVRDVAGEDVTYVQGATSIELKGVPGSGSMQRDDVVDAASIAYSDRDWIFEKAELVAGGVQITPQRGDQVRQTVEGVTTIWEVTLDAGDQAFRYCDRARTRFRVHTKEMPAA